MRSRIAAAVALAPVSLTALSCSFDHAYRDVALALGAECVPGTVQCRGEELSRCDDAGDKPTWKALDRCQERSLVCVPSFLRCAPCRPEETRCAGATVTQCLLDGTAYVERETCDPSKGFACREGSCQNLCARAQNEKSNVGCEYWAVDLDNAVPSRALNAAAQPFAVVLSSVEPDLTTEVTIEVDDAAVGLPPSLRTVATAKIPPGSLEVFYLGSREVDGSPAGTTNNGTHTALTRNAFRIKSSFPIVSYQFNPLENVGVFSNDASQLLPTSALDGPYVIASWPQTIAETDNPDTNFDTNLRAFLTIVGTTPDTTVRVRSKARIVPGPPLPGGVPAGQLFEKTLQPFEVLNLETGDFLADFTGSFVDANHPVVVFAGSEASDAPTFSSLAGRLCCADHLEEQAVPTRAAGKSFAVAHMPSRLDAIVRAGAALAPAPEPELYRVVATQPGTTRVTTTLPPPDDAFTLDEEGAFRTISSKRDFTMTASASVVVADIVVSQEAASVPRGMPGGDPSLTYVPPIEQWRRDYVLLLPDKYAFDFLVLAVPNGADVFLDGLKLGADTCEVAPADGLTDAIRKGPPAHFAYRCPMSAPVITTTPEGAPKVEPGRQNDGVHRLQATKPVGVVVYGFDAFVSYAYAGGTELRTINPR